MSLQGKVAIVTGSGRVSNYALGQFCLTDSHIIHPGPQGIGAAVAIALAQQGANVVIDYVSTSSRALAEGVAKSISELQLANGTQVGKTLVVQANMAKLEDIDRLVKETVDTFGKIDILVGTRSVNVLERDGLLMHTG
jgi:3-oxoacyl-[acyl-carrier protein] reductase